MSNVARSIIRDSLRAKEILERLEEATDYCEDVANGLTDIVAKNR